MANFPKVGSALGKSDYLWLLNDDDDDLAFKSVLTAYDDSMPEKATKHIGRKLKELVDECGADMVIHCIAAAVEAGGRSFKYVATCARNVKGGVGKNEQRKSGYSEYDYLLEPMEQTS